MSSISEISRIYFASDSETNSDQASSIIEDGKNSILITEKEDREELFRNYFQTQHGDEASIFHVTGLQIPTFTSEKITFRFIPSEVASNILPRVSFRATLKFDGNHWRLRRNSFPLTYKWRIYELFWGPKFFCVTDDDVVSVIHEIYLHLCDWADEEEEHRRSKYERFLRGDSDVELNEDDELLFLTEEERKDRASKLAAVLKRMIPPEKKARRKTWTRRMRIRVDSSESSTLSSII